MRDCVTWRVRGHDPLNNKTTRFSPIAQTAVVSGSHRQGRPSFWGALRNAVWSDGGKRQPSVDDAWNDTIRILHSVVNRIKAELKVKQVRLLDVPCGDIAGMSDILSARNDVNYTCFDGRPEVIAKNASPQRIRNDASKSATFSPPAADGIREEFGGEKFLLIVSRHLSKYFDGVDVLKLLNVVSTSGSL